jgi:hypothetical protein
MDEHGQLRDRTHELAERLGVGAEEFEAHFGGCWELVEGPVAHDFDADPSGGGGYDVTPWHVQGGPRQLMIRVFDHGVFLARPHAAYNGAVPAGYDPVDQVYVGRHEIDERAAAVVRGLITRRRRSFRWCACCRRVNAPEDMYGDRCSRCALVVN